MFGLLVMNIPPPFGVFAVFPMLYLLSYLTFLFLSGNLHTSVVMANILYSYNFYTRAVESFQISPLAPLLLLGLGKAWNLWLYLPII